MRRWSVVPKLPFIAAAASIVLALSCAGRGSGTGQPYYGPGTGPIASFIPGGGLGSLNTTEYLYWVNAVTNDIAIYAIDSQTGCMSPVTSGNISTAARPISIAPFPDPTKRFLYVGCAGNGDILIYRIDPQGSGRLTPAPTSFNISNQGAFVDMQFRGDGRFLYVLTNVAVGGGGGQQLTTGVITCLQPDVNTNSSNGGLAPPQNQPGQQIQNTIQLATPQPGLLATSFCIDPNNQFAYVTMSDGRIVIVGLNNQGSLTLVQQTASGQNFINALTAPTCIAAYQTFVYEGSSVSSFLDFLTSNQGQLTLSQGTFDTGGQQPVAIAIPLQGGNLFTVNGQSGNISCFTLASSNGVLGPVPLPPPTVGANVQGAQTAPGVRPRALAINFTGKFAISLTNGQPPMPLIPAQVNAFNVQGGVLVPAPNSTATGPLGQPFVNVQVQKGGQNGEQQLLCPHAIVIHHTN